MNKIWKIKGFTFFILIAFINAFMDLGHKITIQNTIYKVYDGSELTLLTSVINALILLPFIFLFSPSGFLADKYPKNVVMRICAWFGLLLSIIIALCYFFGYFWFAFIATLFMAAQSAIYSPAKYGFIKDLVGKDLLAWGNGVIQAVAIVAILAGMSVFSLLFESLYALSDLGFLAQKGEILQSVAPLGFVLIACALIELYLCYTLPTLTQRTQEVFDKEAYLRGSLLNANFKLLTSHRNIWLSVIGIAVFWSISQLLLATFPTYVKMTFAELNTFKVQMIIACSGFGIIIGSIIAGRFSKQYIETGLIPIGAGFICITTMLILSFSSLTSYAVLFFFFGVGGALFIVPLNALIQFHAKEGELGKILAGNNFVQNIAMLLFLLIGTLVSLGNIDVVYLFYFCMIV